MQNLINQTATKLIDEVKANLLQCGLIAVTTDIWSSTCASEAYLGLTSHGYNHVKKRRQSFKLSKLLDYYK